MNKDFQRTDRVSQEIFRLLNNLLRMEVKDPRLQSVSFTECKISKDLSVATVYFSIMGAKSEDDSVKQAEKALAKAKGFFRSEIGKELKLRIVPDLRFFYDSVPEQVDHIEQLIRKALY